MNKTISIATFLLVFTMTFLGCKEASDSTITKAVYKGQKDMSWAIAHYVEYPLEEMESNRAGIVKVTFEVDQQGNVNEVKAVPDEEISQAEIAIARKKLASKEVLPISPSVIQSLIESVEKLKFKPAMKDGKPVNSTIITSVEFMLI